MKSRAVAAAVLLASACTTVPTSGTDALDGEQLATGTTTQVGSTPSTASDIDPAGGVFSEPTGQVLLFDDGIDGVLSVDLDHRVAGRRVLKNQQAGDAMHRLLRVGDTLVVGWGEIYAISIETLQENHLGDATVFVPAEQPDAVWLISYPGSRIGQGTPTYRLVDLEGTELVSAPGLDPEDHFPALGMPGGLVHETTSGIVLWDSESQEVVRLGEGSNGFVADVSDDLISWCEGECILHLTEIGGKDTTIPSPDMDRQYEPRSSRFSPDGRLLAAIVGDPGPIGPDSKAAIVMVDVASGNATPITEPLLPRPSYLAWSSDGQDLFFSSWPYQQSETLVGWYRPADRHLEVARLPFGGALSFVVLDRDEAESFLPAELGSQAECPQVPGYPSGRHGICGFRF